jgi:hypothetical protein
VHHGGVGATGGKHSKIEWQFEEGETVLCKVSANKWVEGVISHEAGGFENYGFNPSDGGKRINYRARSSFKRVTATDDASKAEAAVAEQKASLFATNFPIEFQALLNNESAFDPQRFSLLKALFLRLTKIAHGKMTQCIKTACAVVLAKSKTDESWFKKDHVFIVRLLEGHMRPLSALLDAKQNSLMFPKLNAALWGTDSSGIADDLKAVLSCDTGPMKWRTLLSLCAQDDFVVRRLQQCYLQQPECFRFFRDKVLELLRERQLQRTSFEFHQDNIALFYLSNILDNVRGQPTPLRYNYTSYSWQEFFQFASHYNEPKREQFLFQDLAAVFPAIPMESRSKAQLPSLIMEVYALRTTNFCGNIVETFVKGGEASRLFAEDTYRSAFFTRGRMTRIHFAPNAAKIILALCASGFQPGDSVVVLVNEMISNIISFHETARPEMILFKLHKEVKHQEKYGQSATSALIRSLTEDSLSFVDPFIVMRFESELEWLQPWLLQRSLDNLLEKGLGLEPAFGDPRWDSFFNKAYAEIVTNGAHDYEPELTLQRYIEAGFISCYDGLRSFIRSLFQFLQGSQIAIKNIYNDEDDEEVQRKTVHLIQKMFPSIFTLCDSVSAADLLEQIAVGSVTRFGKIFAETLLACIIQQRASLVRYVYAPETSEMYDNWLHTINGYFFWKMLKSENLRTFGVAALVYAMQLLDKSVAPRLAAAANDLEIYDADQDALKRLCLQGVPFAFYLHHLPELERILSENDGLVKYPADHDVKAGIVNYVDRLRIFRAPFDHLVELFKTKTLQLRLLEIVHTEYDSISKTWLSFFPAHHQIVSPAAVGNQVEQCTGYISYTETRMKFYQWLDEIAHMENAAEVYAQCQHIVARPEVQTLRALESHTARLRSFVDTFGDVNRQFVEYFMEKDSALFQAYMTAQLKAALQDKGRESECDLGGDGESDEDDAGGPSAPRPPAMLKIEEVKEVIKTAHGQIGDLLKKPDLKLSVLTDASKAMKHAGKTIKEELDIICGFRDYEGSEDMVRNFRLALKLSELCTRLPAVTNVVEQYELAGCKASPGYRKLVDLLENQLQFPEIILFNEVPECLHQVEECFAGRFDGLTMDLFENIGSCAPFFKFVVEERFYDEGKQRFRRERDIITGNLMGEGEGGRIGWKLCWSRGGWCRKGWWKRGGGGEGRREERGVEERGYRSGGGEGGWGGGSVLFIATNTNAHVNNSCWPSRAPSLSRLMHGYSFPLTS